MPDTRNHRSSLLYGSFAVSLAVNVLCICLIGSLHLQSSPVAAKARPHAIDRYVPPHEKPPADDATTPPRGGKPGARQQHAAGKAANGGASSATGHGGGNGASGTGKSSAGTGTAANGTGTPNRNTTANGQPMRPGQHQGSDLNATARGERHGTGNPKRTGTASRTAPVTGEEGLGDLREILARREALARNIENTHPNAPLGWDNRSGIGDHNISGGGEQNRSGDGSYNSGGEGSNNTRGNGSFNESGSGSHNTAGDGSDNKSGDGSNNRRGNGSDNISGNGSNNISRDGSHNRSGNGSNNISGDGSNNRTGDGSNNRSGDGSNNQSSGGSNARGGSTSAKTPDGASRAGGKAGTSSSSGTGSGQDGGSGSGSGSGNGSGNGNGVNDGTENSNSNSTNDQQNLDIRISQSESRVLRIPATSGQHGTRYADTTHPIVIDGRDLLGATIDGRIPNHIVTADVDDGSHDYQRFPMLPEYNPHAKDGRPGARPQPPVLAAPIPIYVGALSLHGTIPIVKHYLVEPPRLGRIIPQELLGDGTGVLGLYYTGANFEQLLLRRPDHNIEMAWTGHTPDPLIPVAAYSVRWIGSIVPRYSERYTISTATDDGVHLWINGKKVIDDWQIQAVSEDSITIDMTAGQPYDFVMEFFEKNGVSGVFAFLYWESDHQQKEFIPESCLRFPDWLWTETRGE